MAEYKTVERSIARVLNRYPFLKRTLKLLYQYLNYIMYKKTYNKKLNKLAVITNSFECGFWGYYDKSPKLNSSYCFHHFDNKNSKYSNDLSIMVNNHIVSTTNTWNWQQGSMLTVLNDKEIIHNFYDKKFKSKIINIENNKEHILDYPIYRISTDKLFALSLNYSRLAKLRPDYGYFNKNYLKISKYDENDGVFYIDIQNNKSKLIISFNDLLNFYPRKEMKNAWHKVNHLDISPNGKRFIFHHRWLDDMGRKWSRLISANIDGSDMFLLADDDMVSHCCWKNNNEVVGWMRKKDFGDGYFLLKDKTNIFSLLGEDVLTEDGHPSFSKNEKWMLTDTYPDKARMTHLLLYNMETFEVINLGSFYSPLKYHGEKRCDLHPRFSPGDREISFDSVHEGLRSMYIMDISKIIDGEVS